MAAGLIGRQERTSNARTCKRRKKKLNEKEPMNRSVSGGKKFCREKKHASGVAQRECRVFLEKGGPASYAKT